jgi:hypothetical protein
MPISVANVGLTNTKDYQRQRINDLAYAMSTRVVSTDSNTATGNAAISGTFSCDVLVANAISIGGGNGSINTTSIAVSNLTANTLFATSANLTSIFANSISANFISGNQVSGNTLSFTSANLTSAKIGTLVVGNSTVNVSIAAANSTLQANGQYYLNANGNWALVQQSSNVATRVYAKWTANASQNSFSYANGIDSSLLDLYYNGVHLSNADYTVTNSTSFQLTTNATNGAIVEMVSYANVQLATFSITAVGSNTQIMFNDSGNANGYNGLAYDKTSNTLSIGSIGHQSIVTSTFGLSPVAIDTIALSTYRCAEYVVSIKDNAANNYQVSKLLMIHNGGTATVTEYGMISTAGTSLGSFDSTANATVASLLFTPTSTSTNITINKVAVAV